MLKDLTVIVPTHERHFLAQRFLSYYAGRVPEIIVVDSSSSPISGVEQYKARYMHLPNEPLPSKLYAAAKLVKTKFLFVCADDDFFSISGVSAGIKFLEKNEDYHSVQGNYVNFDLSKGSKYYWHLYQDSAGYRNDSDVLLKRLKQTFDCQCFYSLRRTGSYLKIAKALRENRHISTVEIGTHLIEPYLGKHAVLNVFWMARDVKNYTNYKSLSSEGAREKDVNLHIYDWKAFLATDEGNRFLKNIYHTVAEEFYSFDKFKEITHQILANRSTKLIAKRNEKHIQSLIKLLRPFVPVWLVWHLKQSLFKAGVFFNIKRYVDLSSIEIVEDEILGFLEHAKKH